MADRIKKMEKKSFFEKILIRFYRWWTRPFMCKFGYHVKQYTNFSYAICSGILTYHCALCEKAIERIALDDLDLSSEERKRLMEILKENWPDKEAGNG